MASNSERRLDRLFPALTARERAVIVLRHYKEGTEPPRAIMATMLQQQSAEYNRLVGFMNAVNCELTFGLLLICAQITQVEIKHGWLMSIGMCIDEIQMLGHAVLQETQDAGLRRKINKLLARTPGQLQVPFEPVDGAERPKGVHTIDWLLRCLGEGIRSGVEQNWRELRAIEIAVEEVAEEFGGEDPLKPDGRGLLDDGLQRCRKLVQDVSVFVEPFELPEPGDADVELVRKIIARAARH